MAGLPPPQPQQVLHPGTRCPSYVNRQRPWFACGRCTLVGVCLRLALRCAVAGVGKAAEWGTKPPDQGLKVRLRSRLDSKDHRACPHHKPATHVCAALRWRALRVYSRTRPPAINFLYMRAARLLLRRSRARLRVARASPTAQAVRAFV